jgi:hypothetical protein
MPPRNAKGRFMKRGHARKAKARRSRPARRVHRRRPVALRKRYSKRYIARARRRPSKTGKRLRAIRRIPKGHRVAGLVRLNPAEFAAMTANPRKRHRRRRRNPGAVAVNARRRRHHRRTARNPAFNMGLVKSTLPIAVGGVGGGFLAGALDSSLLAERSTAVKAAAKAGTAVVSELLLRRKAPRVADGITGGLMGSVGYSLAVNMGGGVVADNKRHALKHVAAKGLGDPEMAAMLGDVVDANMLADIANGEYDGHLADVVDAS